MSTIKKSVSIVLALLMLIGVFTVVPITVEAKMVGDFQYELRDDGTAEIAYYKGSDKDVIIPAEIDGYTVTAICAYAFENRSMVENITIPKTVKYIYLNAFEDTAYYKDKNNWTDGVLYIGDCLITAETEITGKIIIKDGTRLIASYAFEGCEKLENVTIPNSARIINYDAFRECKGLREIDLPGSLTEIGSGAFYNCVSLTKAVVQNGIKKIEMGTFENCKSLDSITLPDSIETIENNAFGGTAYYKDDANWQNNVLYINNHLIAAKTSIEGQYIVNDKTVTVAEHAFNGCRKLENVSFPNSVKYINDNAFDDCNSLKNINLPDSVLSIGERSFQCCPSVETVTIGSGLKSIGEGAFSADKKIAYITVSKANEKYMSDNGVLYNKTKTELIQYAPAKADTGFSIPESVTVIACYAFCDSENLTKIIFPEALTTIEYYAFANCKNLSVPVLPAGLSNIGEKAFSNCESFDSIEIPSGVKKIEGRCFDGCSSLASVTLNNGLEEIGECAFFDCPNLLQITIPSSVKTIRDLAFGFRSSGYDFEPVEGTFVIYGYAGSEAERYAESFNIQFVNIGEVPTEPTEPGDGSELGGIYFDARGWKNFNRIYCHIVNAKTGDCTIWQNSQELCERVNGTLYYFDFDKLAKNGYEISAGTDYLLIFSSNINHFTYDITFSTECINDIVYLTGNTLNSPIDSNKNAYEAKWTNNCEKYGPHLVISSENIVMGEFMCPHETKYDVFMNWVYSNYIYHFNNSSQFDELKTILKNVLPKLNIYTNADLDKLSAMVYKLDLGDGRMLYKAIQSLKTVTPPSINKTKVSIKAGGTVTLKVTNGTVKTWSTSNKAVATVSKCKVTGLKKGTATITATLTTGKKLTCKVTVTTSPKLSRSSVTVKKGKTVSVKITGKAATVKNVYTNTKIAKVISKNTVTTFKVKGLKKGSTTLKIKVNGVVLKLKVKVK